MNTWVLWLRRRKALQWMIRSRSRWKTVALEDGADGALWFGPLSAARLGALRREAREYLRLDLLCLFPRNHLGRTSWERRRLAC
jgi:hypothetical protein